jgi:NAD(P)-dependent dehydrogenase (short-subunit alcohol dehydrogenase family)
MGKPVCVITGGNGGMAEALERLIGHEYDMLLSCRSEEKTKDLLDKLAAEGIRAQGAVCRVQNRDEVRALAKRAAEMGEVKAVVHTSGVSTTLAKDNLREIVETNALGTAYVVEEFLPVMDKGSSLLNVSSAAAHYYERLFPKSEEIDELLRHPLEEGFVDRCLEIIDRFVKMNPEQMLPGFVAYQLTKYFVNHYTFQNVMRFTGRKGIRINSVSPGSFETKMGLAEKEKGGGEERMLRNPIPRFGYPKEIAEVLAFMISDKASYITGTDLLVDGGSFISKFEPQTE